MKTICPTIDSIRLPSKSNDVVYILKVLPLRDIGRIAAIADNNSLNILDPSHQLDFPFPNGLQIRDIHTDSGKSNKSGVTCLEQIDAHTVATAGRDGFVNLFDLRKARHDVSSQSVAFSQLSGFPTMLRPEKKLSINTMATSEWLIALGNELQQNDPVISVWDRRKWSRPLVQYSDFHSDEPTQVKSKPPPSPSDRFIHKPKPRCPRRKFRLPKLAFHPQSSQYLLSGAEDGVLNVLDTAVSDPDDAAIIVRNLNRSINHAGFLDPTYTYGVSDDHMIDIIPISVGNPEIEDGRMPKEMDLRSELTCKYIIGLSNDGQRNYIIAGADADAPGEEVTSNRVDVWPIYHGSTAWQIDRNLGYQLEDAHGGGVVRSFCFYKDRFITGGEDGSITVWQNVDETATESSNIDHSGNSSKRSIQASVDGVSKKRAKKV